MENASRRSLSMTLRNNCFIPEAQMKRNKWKKFRVRLIGKEHWVRLLSRWVGEGQVKKEKKGRTLGTMWDNSSNLVGGRKYGVEVPVVPYGCESERPPT